MDESKSPIPLSESHLRSASERTSAEIDPEFAELTNSGDFGAAERQSCSRQAEILQNEPPDQSSVAVYCRSEEEVREGFLTALRAMGVAVVDQRLEPETPPLGGAKP